FSEKCKIDFDKIIRIKDIDPKYEPTYISNNVPVIPMQTLPVPKASYDFKPIQFGGHGSCGISNYSYYPSLYNKSNQHIVMAQNNSSNNQNNQFSSELISNPNAYL